MRSKVTLSIVFFVASLGLGFISYNRSPFYQAVLLGLAMNACAIGVGILVVNYYLESASRKDAVKALLMLSSSEMAKFHNEFLQHGWDVFGKDAFSGVLEEYVNAEGDPNALSVETRGKIYGFYATDPVLTGCLTELDNSMTELSRLAGWSLDPELLSSTLRARTSILRLRAVQLDGSPKSHTKVTKHLLDTDYCTAKARKILRGLAGIQDDGLLSE